jgi:hypothetical protein
MMQTALVGVLLSFFGFLGAFSGFPVRPSHPVADWKNEFN